MRTDEEERWRTAGGGKGAPPPPPPLLSSEAGFLAALLSVRLRVLADLDRVCALVQGERPSVVARIAGHASLFQSSRAVFFAPGRRRSTFFSFAHRAIFLSLVRNKTQVLSYDIDLLNPPAALEARKHKLKRLVQSPNSYFMDVKCQGCFQITVVFSNSQTVVVCPACSAVLCTPTGGRARLTEGCSFRKKGD